jgi:mannobiose 2-epimerase
MIHPESGAGLNQLSLDFEPVPTPDRARSERNEEPLDITSYGHNVELAWLLVRAGEALGKPRSTYAEVVKRLCNHALKYGLDTENGGIYREGLHDAPAFDLRKEWWQNAEALVGFLDAYEITSDKNYLNAFAITWRFDDTYMINHDVGEWYTIAEPDGTVIRAAMGHTWKSAYHTTRAMQESIKRIDMILGK